MPSITEPFLPHHLNLPLSPTSSRSYSSPYHPHSVPTTAQETHTQPPHFPLPPSLPHPSPPPSRATFRKDKVTGGQVWYVKYHAKLYQVLKASKVLKAEDGSLTSTSTDPSCVWRKKIHGALLFGSERSKQSMLMV